MLLALAGAGVDAVILIAFNVLTAAQTGNTILLAVALAEERLAVGASAAVSVIGYVIGAAAGELSIVRHTSAHPERTGFTLPLLAESALLGGAMALWRLHDTPAPPGIAIVALAAVAMGMQSAVVLRLHAGTTTTYVTGMLTTFTTGLVRRLLLGAARGAGGTVPGAGDGEPAEAFSRLGLTWVVYAASAVGCALLFLRFGELVLLVPVAAVLAAAGASAARSPRAAAALAANAGRGVGKT